ncbi:MAG: cadmium-translocating P-type ATPase [Clostridium sp.]|nr:cadmium-translocating P-type ATPase [Clostridium sp.]
MKKYEMILQNLDCKDCANKIEEKIKKINGIKSVSINFVTKKLAFELSNENLEKGDVISSISSIAENMGVILEHGEDKGEYKHIIDKNDLMSTCISILLFSIAFVPTFPYWTKFLLFFVSYLLAGKNVLIRAARNISLGQLWDENFLMTVATVGAFFIGEFPEGAAVMIFYRIGKFLENAAVNRSRNSIADLMNIKPDYANIKIGEGIKKVSPEQVNVGDVIVVKPGEKIPLDGKIIFGDSTVDMSMLTGEFAPKDVGVKNDVLSGSINRGGLLYIEVTKKYTESTVSKILDLVQNASNKKTETENFITKFSKLYTPLVISISVLLAFMPPFIIPGETFSKWFYRSLVFLVISCPCALVISIPLGYFGGIGAASKYGILLKGSNYLEALSDINTVVFDKTGTITKGIFKVSKLNPTDGFSEGSLLKYAAIAESLSNHPIAISITKAYGKEIDVNKIENFKELAGRGIKLRYGNEEILAGNKLLLQESDIEIPKVNMPGTAVYIAIDKDYAGNIVISDQIKDDAKKTLSGLKRIGIKNLVMLTGDNKEEALRVGSQLQFDHIYAELLPHQKVEKIEEIAASEKQKNKMAFVGDGINDAPVLSMADIGISMGGLGSDAAMEAADIVLMTDEPSKLIDAIKISRATKRIIRQNIIWAFGVKIMVLLLGAGGIATMWEAVFADVGVTLLAVVNSMRLIKRKKF